MINAKRKSGFTLTEVLISAGILAVGFMLIAGAFPVGVKLTSLATERTIGSVTAQEAIAKIKIYGLGMSYWDPFYADPAARIIPLPPDVGGLTYGNCIDYSSVALLDWEAITADLPYLGFIPVLPPEYEYYYPSTNLAAEKKYRWSALCRRTGTNQIQATIFVSRLGGPGIMYPANPIPIDRDPAPIDYPQPYMIQGIIRDPDDFRKLLIPTETPAGDPADYSTYFREGAVIYDDINGYLFTIQEPTGADMIVELDRGWPYAYDNSITGEIYEYNVWVIPSAIKKSGSPATLGGRWPCVWVFQDIIEVADFSQIIEIDPGP